MSYGVGAAYSFDQKLTVTADFQLNQWAKVNMPAYSLAGATGDVELTNSSMISFGAEYLPDNRLATTIFSRIKYRIGAYRYRDYIKYYGTEINETGFSVGLGLPILRDKSSLNISFIWGSKGSTSNNLIKENFARVTLDITMFEYWFIKRKFD